MIFFKDLTSKEFVKHIKALKIKNKEMVDDQFLTRDYFPL
jgi:hypothetical protein